MTVSIYNICHFYPLNTGGLFHSIMLDESICHFRGVGFILSLLFHFLKKTLLANIEYPDQTPHDAASDLGPHRLLMTPFAGFLVRMD